MGFKRLAMLAVATTLTVGPMTITGCDGDDNSSPRGSADAMDNDMDGANSKDVFAEITDVVSDQTTDVVLDKSTDEDVDEDENGDGELDESDEVLNPDYYYEIPPYCEAEKPQYRLSMHFEGMIAVALGYKPDSTGPVEVITSGPLDPEVGPFNIDSKGGCNYLFGFRNDGDLPTTLRFGSDQIGVILERFVGLNIETIEIEQEGLGETEMTLEPGEERNYTVRISQ